LKVLKETGNKQLEKKGKTLLYSFKDDYKGIAEKEGASFFYTTEYSKEVNEEFLDKVKMRR